MRVTFIILWSFVYFSCLAQEVKTDSVVELDQVQISASRLNNYTTGLKVVSIDSLSMNIRKFDNLDELISTQTPIYIKSYGQGSLATISFRGTAATHTGVYWNGIQLNPPNIRQFDLSLAPGAYFNSVQIQSGGSSSVFGSGNIGGSIHLNTGPIFNNGLNLSATAEAGSFGQYGANAGAKVSGNKFYSSTGILYKTSQNDFPYYNLRKEKVYQTNGAYNHIGFLQDLFWKFHKRWLAGISFWIQSNSREIPASMTSKPSFASQDDNSFKTIISLKNSTRNGFSEMKLAFLHDDLHYLDPDAIEEINQDSKITTDKVIGEFQTNRQIARNSGLNAGINLSYESGNSNNYNGYVSQDQIGLFVSYLQAIPSLNWSLSANLRQEFIEGYHVPFTPSFGAEGRIWKVLYGKMNISRNFRAPSFNELYWIPYGNEDLNPEESWNEEASLVIKLNRNPNKHNSDFTATIYNSNVNDWIIWVPQGNSVMPENIKEVWSRGLEFNGSTVLKFKRINIQLNEGYTYALSTSEKKLTSNDNSYKKQLIYVPKHRAFIDFTIQYRGAYLNYNQSYTGIRYTTADNNDFLPAYSIGSLKVWKEFILKKHGLRLQFDIQNIWNTSYQAIEYYPMPGRYFRFSINYSFNKV